MQAPQPCGTRRPLTFSWRKAARAGVLTLPSDAALQFVPVVTAVGGDCAMPAPAASGSAAVSIEIGGVIVRAAPGVDLAWLRDVLRVVKAAT